MGSRWAASKKRISLANGNMRYAGVMRVWRGTGMTRGLIRGLVGLPMTDVPHV